MSYLVIARKFRPQNFAEVSGQDHVTRTLVNSIKRDRIAHAYLFAGPRGVGKTSVARILAKALNCTNRNGVEPCGVCSNCLEIAQGINLAVREIDGASHNSVDNVRDLIDSFRAFPPPGSLYKIYIIDEVHMLSISAFNALLKSLEEPPPNTVFILATTDAHKIPETVISRCQRHEFRTIGSREIVERLKQIAANEKIDVEGEALEMIARLSEGSMRDAQSLLDRVNSYCDDRIGSAQVSAVLGTVEQAVLFELADHILSLQPLGALNVVDRVFSTGTDPALLLHDFVHYFRNLLLAKLGDAQTTSNAHDVFAGEQNKLLSEQARKHNVPELLGLLNMARDGADMALRSTYAKYAFEALVVRMSCREGLSASSAQQIKPANVQQVSLEAEKMPLNSSASRPQASMNWRNFVAWLSSVDNVSRIFQEQLKRLNVQGFKPGVLSASGPLFAIQYLKEVEHNTRLEQLLKDFSGTAEWTLRLEQAEQEDGSLSLHAEEQAKRKDTEQLRAKSLVEHPMVKSLQKAFPGSKIESIRLKTEEL